MPLFPILAYMNVIGIRGGKGSRPSPSHTTGHTGPYTAVHIVNDRNYPGVQRNSSPQQRSGLAKRSSSVPCWTKARVLYLTIKHRNLLRIQLSRSRRIVRVSIRWKYPSHPLLYVRNSSMIRLMETHRDLLVIVRTRSQTLRRALSVSLTLSVRGTAERSTLSDIGKQTQSFKVIERSLLFDSKGFRCSIGGTPNSCGAVARLPSIIPYIEINLDSDSNNDSISARQNCRKSRGIPGKACTVGP